MNISEVKDVAIVVVITIVFGSLASFGIREWRRQSSAPALETQLEAMERELRFAVATSKTTQQSVRALSGIELNQRMDVLGSKLVVLEKQLTSLQQIISPSNASEILTVARMRDEVMARAGFEQRINAYVTETRNQVDELQMWLLGTCGAVIASLIGIAIFLVRRSATLYAAVNALQEKPAEGTRR